jgi:hypothetical protein
MAPIANGMLTSGHHQNPRKHRRLRRLPKPQETDFVVC